MFMMNLLKCLSDNSDIFIILMLASIHWLFFIQFEVFLVLGMSDFLVKPRHYIMGVGISLNFWSR